ncbi:MAG: class I SAM-dependent methyltransferase [Patescibacteria group bacterium]
MKKWLAPAWSDYELLDFGNGRRLERFGQVVLSRPDFAAQNRPSLSESDWQKAEARFLGQGEKRGEWQTTRTLPEKWLGSWNGLKYWTKLTPFKHTGIFPEQSVQWELMQKVIANAVNSGRSVRVLNLFAYTGLASLAAAAVGAEVTTVDSSRPAMTWFRENQVVSDLHGKPVRLILEDALKFVEREAKRQHKYDVILMDPPAFGNGPKGEKWQFRRNFPQLIEATKKIVSNQPLLLLINTYTDDAGKNILKRGISNLSSGYKGKIEFGDLGLLAKTGQGLTTGSYAMWRAD